MWITKIQSIESTDQWKVTLESGDEKYVPRNSTGYWTEAVNEWLSKNTPEPEFTEEELLSRAKEAKRQEIRSAFEAESNSPVLVGDASYHGGFDSAMKLDAAKRLAEAAGVNEVVFFDVSNTPHTLTLEEAQEVITSIGAKYQSDFANKQVKMVAVENATTIEEVEAV